MHVSVVILTWNRRDELKHTLDHVSNHLDALHEVIVVDNGSTDGTLEMLAERPWVTTLKPDEDLGVDQGRNLGAETADGELVLFLDDDGFFDFAALPSLRDRFASSPPLGLIACKIVDMPFEEARAKDFENHRDSTEFRPHASFTGAGFMVLREAFMDVGGFPDYFGYGQEEGDLALRLLKEGYTIEQAPHAVMLHYASPNQRPSLRAVRGYYRNRHFEIWRNIPAFYAVHESLSALIGGFARTCTGHAFKAYREGTIEALKALPRVIKEERDPMSHGEYRRHRKKGGLRPPLVERLGRLMGDIR